MHSLIEMHDIKYRRIRIYTTVSTSYQKRKIKIAIMPYFLMVRTDLHACDTKAAGAWE